ncbi:acyl-CoA dehydrogenase [Malaciobacter molluscorum LMG 25693]|uniref:Acyl-coenzyme A dehydrogenase n=1 Tax=Malaciobacter molluscorum LMG 25693 TaxID=870501 RepID=A0A2G1DL94_9BACT|nr:acyl-CoA dehydrogenase [Malaciobacter molluscorum]AXX92053.1 acyl-CoA dehydrogenase [Malaciobacter molluscorum LMG 25693]PHO19283.1 acyl-CoA dehydrogenase [Malaciobacter molluscorum LMG 25693]
METLIFILILLIFAFYAYPAILWFAFIGIYSLIFFDMSIAFWIIFAILAIVILNTEVRKHFFIKNILNFIKIKNLVPNISKTEQEALEAGTNFIEEDFFKGEVNFEKVKNQKNITLTQEEQEFLDNKVDELCKIESDWQIFQNRDISKKSWEFIKSNKFFGMIIPKEYGGLGFSATAHSKVIEKLVSRSQVLAITIMVPNSLGPAELILKHGTKKQKDYYLPRLATAQEIPCFALTEPNAGSDATSITSSGEIFKDDKGKLKIKLNFEKRYITLGNIATLIGLAFVLKDPNNLFSQNEDLGITFAIIDSKTKGVDNSNRHDPLGIPFVNSPLFGKDVIIDFENIIGGEEGIGKGWQMLVESLSIGRGISLPSVSLGGSKLALKVVNSYTQLREQFGLSINKFEGIEEKIAKIAAFTYLLNASRNYTLDAIDSGIKPAVINSVMKYHSTEKFREIINDSMDILGGAGIIRGEKNLLAHAYFALPISITVEGANILTRNLMQFGQGLIKSHPYLYKQVIAIKNNDINSLDKALTNHIKSAISLSIKSLIYFLTRGLVINTKGEFKQYKRKLVWASTSFASLTNITLAILGANIKKKENISARLADILSWLYLITSTIREYENNTKKQDRILVDYICKYGFYKIQEAREDIIQNIPFLKLLNLFIRSNPIGIKPEDKLNKKIIDLLNDENNVNNLCDNLFIPNDKNEILYKLQEALILQKDAIEIFERIKYAIKHQTIKKSSFLDMIEESHNKGVITNEEYEKLKILFEKRMEVINVDYFNDKVYKKQR